MKIIISKEKQKQDMPKVPFVFKHRSSYHMAVKTDSGRYRFVRLNGSDPGCLSPISWDTLEEMLVNIDGMDEIIEADIMIYE